MAKLKPTMTAQELCVRQAWTTAGAIQCMKEDRKERK